MTQIEITHFEHERIAEDGLSAHAVHFGRSKCTHRTCETSTESQLLVYSECLINLDYLRGWPNLDGFHFAASAF